MEGDIDFLAGAAYNIEHLATFSFNSQRDILSPKHAINRLLHMEKTTGIWTQKMQLRLWNSMFFIIDSESGDLVERFSIDQIREPCCVTSRDFKQQLYNNVLIFTAYDNEQSAHIESLRDHPLPQSEMHLFQCLDISADDLVSVIQTFISAPSARVADSITDSKLLYDRHAYTSSPQDDKCVTTCADSCADLSLRGHDTLCDSSSCELTPRLSPTSEAPRHDHSRDVAILNHCFDDIEAFVVRVQPTVTVAREFQRKRVKRQFKKKDYKHHINAIASKMPNFMAFVEILQKFKLSFNLLARLKGVIHEPNAPELVHFLFSPLALIIDISRSCGARPTHLSCDVVTPLLTRQAVQLLANCLSSKETDLWRSLGDVWFVPREQWPKHMHVEYKPVFFDGWSPDLQSSSLETSSFLADSSVCASRHHHKVIGAGHVFDHNSRNISEISACGCAETLSHDAPYSSSPFHDCDAKLSHMSAYSASNYNVDSSIDSCLNCIEEEAVLEVSLDARNNDKLGAIHCAPVVPREAGGLWLPRDIAAGADARRYVRVSYPRTANTAEELTVARGECLQVLDNTRRWWRVCNSHGHVGFVPHTIVSPIT